MIEAKNDYGVHKEATEDKGNYHAHVKIGTGEAKNTYTMHLMYYEDENGKRVYTLKVQYYYHMPSLILAETSPRRKAHPLCSPR